MLADKQQKLLSTLLQEVDLINKHQLILNLNDYQGWKELEEAKKTYKKAVQQLLIKNYPNCNFKF